MQPADQHPCESPASVRIVARLDAATRAKVDDFAAHFHQPRAAVLCAIMRWGLTEGPTGTPDQGQAQGLVCPLHLYVDADVHACAEQAARAAGLKLSPWLRAMARQIPLTAFSPSWQAARVEQRSHDSRTYDVRFMLRLDRPS